MSNDSPLAPPFQVGDVVLDRYRVSRLLGQDIVGYTFVVTPYQSGSTQPPDESGEVYVLRQLRARLVRGSSGAALLDGEALHLWRSQLARLPELHSERIVRTYETCGGDDHGRVFIIRAAVELEAQPLAALLAAQGALSEPEAVRLCSEIGAALDVAHQHGILHLGLSPNRVFVKRSEHGVAIEVADFALLPPQWAAAYGEVGYLSPEQVEGQACDRRTDQFVLAVILYEMLAGCPAFIAAADEERRAILSRVVNEDPLPLALPQTLELALSRALSRSKGVRFPGVVDFVRALGPDGVAWMMVAPPGSALSPVQSPARLRVLRPMAIGAFSAVFGLALYFFLTQKPASGPGDEAANPLVDAARPQPRPTIAEATKPPDLASATAVVASSSPSRDGGASPDLGPAGTRVAQAGPGEARTNVPPLRMGSTPAIPTPPGPPVATSLPRPGATETKPPISKPVAPPVAVASAFSGPLDVRIEREDGGALTTEQRDIVKSCLRMVKPRPPVSVLLENISGTLYVSPGSPDHEILGSGDFRDCLKLRVKGKIAARSVLIKGTAPKVGP